MKGWSKEEEERCSRPCLMTWVTFKGTRTQSVHRLRRQITCQVPSNLGLTATARPYSVLKAKLRVIAYRLNLLNKRPLILKRLQELLKVLSLNIRSNFSTSSSNSNT